MNKKFNILRTILGDYSKEVNKSALRRSLFFFVAVPTIVAAFYYLLVASDIYISETKFSVNVEDGGSIMPSQLGALMTGGGAVMNIQEAMIVQEFIHSRTMLDMLEETLDLADIYNKSGVDPLSSLSMDESKEAKINYLVDMIEVNLDEISGITSLKVRAFAPEDARKVAMLIINQTEDFVNTMSNRVQDDAINFAKRDLAENEDKILEANLQLTKFRNENNNFDPTVTTAGVLDIIGQLESSLAQTQAEIAELKNFMQSESPQITAMEARAKSLSDQINEQTGRLATEGGAPLAELVQEYEKLKAFRDFALARYELSLKSLEAAQVDARRKSKYLLRIVEPTLPESAQEPLRLKMTFTVFLMCLIGYSIAGLIIAAIRDHIRPT